MYIMIYTCTYFRYLYNEVSNWIQMTNHIVKQGNSLYMLIRKLLLLGMNKKYQVLSSGLWKVTKWYCAVNQFAWYKLSQNSFTDSVISLVHLNCSFAQWTGQEVWPWPWGGLLSKGLFYKDSSSLTLFGPLLVPWNWLGPGECFEGVYTVKISPPGPLLEPWSRPSPEEQSDAF